MTRSVQHIAFVCPRFSAGGTVGGAETLLKNLAFRAAGQGLRVEFLTTCADDHFTWKNTRPPGVEQVDGITVRYFPVDEDRDVRAFLAAQERICRGEKRPDDEETWMRNSVNSRALQAYLRQCAPDRIVAGPYLFGLTYYTVEPFPERTLLVPCLHDEAFAYLDIIRRMFHRAAGFMFNSEPERELAERLYGRLPGAAQVVGMGLDPFDSDPAAFARKHGLTAPYLLYAGRREPLKGTPILPAYLQAFRKRTGRDVHLALIGRGPIDAPPETNPYILDAGFVSEQEKHDAMAGAAAFVHPSVNESFGIVLLESWLAGAPALVHAGSAVLTWQCRRSGGGLWFRHYPDFEEMLNLLLDNPDASRKMGQSGRAYVEREYAWDRVTERMINALEAGSV